VIHLGKEPFVAILLTFPTHSNSEKLFWLMLDSGQVMRVGSALRDLFWVSLGL
jgi:hypothetical protein